MANIPSEKMKRGRSTIRGPNLSDNRNKVGHIREDRVDYLEEGKRRREESISNESEGLITPESDTLGRGYSNERGKDLHGINRR